MIDSGTLTSSYFLTTVSDETFFLSFFTKTAQSENCDFPTDLLTCMLVDRVTG